MAQPTLHYFDDVDSAVQAVSPWDAVVLVTSHVEDHGIELIDRILHQARSTDLSLGSCTQLMVVPEVAGGRLVLAPTGPLDRDHDDVRRFYDAAKKGMTRARESGASAPLLLVAGVPNQLAFAHAAEVSTLGALQALWEPLEAREHDPDACEPVRQLAIQPPAEGDRDAYLEWLSAVEAGRRAARDVAGTQPERMTPILMADYCHDLFANSVVQTEIISDLHVIEREYPLAFAVARASLAVPRHHPRIIRLSYTPPGEITQTLMFAGKGLSYDTGGADLKVGGHMVGMSRDKGGAAAVIGLMKFLADLRPEGTQVIAEVGCVRNSVGADSYVSDEIVQSHAGCRVRIGNTDAEGRLVLADLLSHLREKTVEAPSAHLFSVATLTGHAVRAVGPYSIAIDNGPAFDQKMAARFAEMGDLWADPFELSRLRREDWDFVRPRSSADDVLSANNAPSTMTDRGHQFPMAFLIRASGLESHGKYRGIPIAYTHIDIGGSAYEQCDWQHGRPTAAPLTALAATFFRP